MARLPFFRRVVEPANALLYDEIARGRADPNLEQRDDVLSLLLAARHEDGSPMSDTELRDELMTLLVAGHETTATALAWALEALARHPRALARLREEVDRGEDAYLDAVIKETLRLRPVVALVLRRLTAPMEIGGRMLPAGVSVAPCIYLLHRRPELYPDPRAFRPERFLEQPPGTYTWIPFGGGVRRCLGASFAQFEMRVVLREVVARLELRPGSARPERRVRRAIFFSPSRGGEVTVRRRDAGGRAGQRGGRAGYGRLMSPRIPLLIVALAAVTALAVGGAVAPAETGSAAAVKITPTGVGGVKIGRTFSNLRNRGLVGPIRPGCELAPNTRSARLRAGVQGQVNFTQSTPRRVTDMADPRRRQGARSGHRGPHPADQVGLPAGEDRPQPGGRVPADPGEDPAPGLGRADHLRGEHPDRAHDDHRGAVHRLLRVAATRAGGGAGRVRR